MQSLKKQNKEMWPVAKLQNWADNPRSVADEDIGRLKEQITEAGGLYKPLIITPKGIVLGGNMRLRALQELGIEEAWVSVVKPKDREEMLKYALSDNGRAGTYDENLLADVIKTADFDASMQALFKAETKPPVSIETLLAETTESILGGEDEPDTDTTKEAKEKYDNADIKQVVLFMNTEDKKRMEKQFESLRDGMRVGSSSEVLLGLISCYERDHGKA